MLHHGRNLSANDFRMKVKLPAHPVKTGQAWLGLPGNVVIMITGSALTPLRESVAALPAY